MAIKDLGPVTAYAYAVQGGYTGTEQEFTEALGQAGITLAELEGLRAVATTLAEGQQATASYANGVLTLGIPRGATGSTGAKGDKGDTGETGNGIESIVLTSTVGSVKTYTITFTDGTTTTFEVKDGEVTEESLEEDLEDYAKNNGYYDEFTAGSAEQLLSTQFVEDSVPYKFRTSGGSKDIGNREYDEIVGGSIVWNQLIKISDGTATGDGITTVRSNGKLTYNGTFAGVAYSHATSLASNVLNNFVAGHRYLITINSTDNRLYIVTNNPYTGSDGSGVANNRKWMFYTPTSTPTFFHVRIKASNGDVVDGSGYVQAFDLTKMFGSQIADYIYQLEQAQSGKGVTFFKSLFPNDYYPYNAGELLSVEGLQSHDTVGFNQWDEEWELGAILGSNGQNTSASDIIRSKNFCSCLPNTEYYVLAPSYINIFYYDSNKAYISYETKRNTTITTPSNARYFKISTTNAYGTAYKNDICINLSWSGWRNGEYEPYKKHSYALDSSLTLRGIPNLDSSNNLYYRGDTYEHDGTVTRWCRTVELGSLDWMYNSTFNVFYTSLGVNPEPSEATGGAYAMLPNYPYTPSFVTDNTKDKCCEIGRSGYFINMLIVRDTSYSDVASFKASMNGVYAIYKLATPTEETAEPYTSPQAVDDFGTEEYISGNVVPVGHNTQYPANLRDKLQHLPNLADNDGYYMISQQNKQMSLELFRIPKAPTTDGTYILKATVSGGTPTYIWESEETE